MSQAIIVLVVLIIISGPIFATLRLLARIKSIRSQTATGNLGKVEALTALSAGPRVAQVLTALLTRRGGAASLGMLANGLTLTPTTQSPEERIKALEQLHQAGSITDEKLASLTAAIKAEPAVSVATGQVDPAKVAGMLDTLRKSGFLTEDALTKISAAMGAAGVAANPTGTASTSGSGVQEAHLAAVDDLHARKVITDAEHSAARAAVLKT